MKAWIIKEELEWLELMQSEGRTREILISNGRRFEDNREIEVDIKECDKAREDDIDLKKELGIEK
jgi:hypothetical protein